MTGSPLLGPLPVVPDATWDRMSRIEPMSGPRCYLCNRLFRERDRIVIVATGPGQERTHFRAAAAGEAPQGEASENDHVYVGAECVRRYVPAEAIAGERRR